MRRSQKIIEFLFYQLRIKQCITRVVSHNEGRESGSRAFAEAIEETTNRKDRRKP